MMVTLAVPTIELVRLEESYDYGTFGVLRIQKQLFCCTLEPRDELNARNISSIPAQQYICKRIQSPRWGETFQILDVPGRTGCLFHQGNVVEHTEGCVILGNGWGKLGKNRAVLNSGDTFRGFMRVFEGVNMIHLTVVENY
jgi:hypothetical protein